jgi:hypothetical protein
MTTRKAPNPTNRPTGTKNRDVKLPVTPTTKSHLKNKQDGTKGNNVSHSDTEKNYTANVARKGAGADKDKQ